jgi:hypothetical protein
MPSIACIPLRNIWHLTGLFSASPSPQGAKESRSWIRPWFHAARQSSNKEEQGKHGWRWRVMCVFSLLRGYLQDSLWSLLCRCPTLPLPLAGFPETLHYLPFPFLCLIIPLLPPPQYRTAMPHLACCVLPYSHVFILAMSLLGIFSPDLWAFKLWRWGLAP